MKKSYLIATIAGGLLFFILGFLLYAVSGIMDGYATEVGKAASKSEEQVNVLFIFLGDLIMALGTVSIYGKWARGVHNFEQGFKLGVWLGIILGVGMNMVWMATSNFMVPMGFVVDGLFQIISFGLVGGITALIYKKWGDD